MYNKKRFRCQNECLISSEPKIDDCNACRIVTRNQILVYSHTLCINTGGIIHFGGGDSIVKNSADPKSCKMKNIYF